MTWFNTFADDEQFAVEELQRKGFKNPHGDKKERGLFESTVAAVASPIRGTGVGFIKTADMLANPFDFMGDAASYGVDYIASGGDIPSFSQYREKAVQARDKLVLDTIGFLEDKENAGIVENIGVALGDYIWRGQLVVWQAVLVVQPF